MRGQYCGQWLGRLAFKQVAKDIAPEVTKNDVGNRIRIRFDFLANKSHQKEDLGIDLPSDPVEADAAANCHGFCPGLGHVEFDIYTIIRFT